jgi:hypothetical protein
MVSFCLLGLHEEQKGRLREKWGGAMERGRIGLCRKVGLAWIGVGVGSRIGSHKNPLIYRHAVTRQESRMAALSLHVFGFAP